MSGSRTLEVPGWLKRLYELSGRVTETGLHGLLDHYAVTMPLGEALARGAITPSDLEELLSRKSVQVADAMQWPSVLGGFINSVDPQVFWRDQWKRMLGREIDVPLLPTIKPKTRNAIDRYQLMLVYLPALKQTDYPSSFIRMADVDFGRLLVGEWVLVETVPQFKWSSGERYFASNLGDQMLIDHCPPSSRMNVTWGNLRTEIVPEWTKVWGLSRGAVRIPSVEQLNLIGNVFRWMRETLPVHYTLPLPDLNRPTCLEWCANKDTYETRLVLGESEGASDNSLGRVSTRHTDRYYKDVMFRLIAVLR